MKGVERIDIVLCRRVIVKAGGIHLAYVGHAVHAATAFPFTLRRVAIYVQVRGLVPPGPMFVEIAGPNGEIIAADDLPRPTIDASGIGETWVEARSVAFPNSGLYSVRVLAGNARLGDAKLLVLP